MKIYVDIDETICITPSNRDYSLSVPIIDNINKVNSLYKDNFIVYWTSRGRETKIDWSEITKKQLSDWGVKYHKLEFNKPYDIVIDDKAINSCDFYKIQDFL